MDMVCSTYMVNSLMKKTIDWILSGLFRLPYIDETTNERLNTIRSKTSKESE
jgi:hypothetical protein